jgi:isochorismate hydrolase
MIDKQFAIITRYGTFHKDALLKALSEEGRKQLYSIWGVAEKKAEPQLVYAGVN